VLGALEGFGVAVISVTGLIGARVGKANACSCGSLAPLAAVYVSEPVVLLMINVPGPVIRKPSPVCST
jgi:hypothetical protein